MVSAGWLWGALVGVLGVAQAGEPVARWERFVAQPAEAQMLWCGMAPLRVVPVGPALQLEFGGETRVVVPARSASGARYTALGGDATEFWNKGEQTELTWDGVAWPTCAPEGAVITPFRASGNEPFWQVRYDGWTITLTTPDGSSAPLEAEVTERSASGTVIRAKGTAPLGAAAAGAPVVAGNAGGTPPVTFTVQPGLCSDSMTGMPHPATVTLAQSGQSWQGCGGDPARLLQGADWQIEHLNGAPVLANTAPTVQFWPDNRVSGQSGCNRFVGGYALTGEGLQLQPLAGTRMACDDAVLNQEIALLKVLQAVQAFERPTGTTLVLRGPDGEIVARLPEPLARP